MNSKIVCTGGGMIYEHGKEEPVYKFRGRSRNPYIVEHVVQWGCVLDNKPHNEAEYGAMSTATAILGRAATYSGRMVRIRTRGWVFFCAAVKSNGAGVYPRDAPL